MRANVDILATGVAVILMLMLVGPPQKGVPARAQQGAPGAARHLKHNAVPLSELVSRHNPLCTVDATLTTILQLPAVSTISVPL